MQPPSNPSIQWASPARETAFSNWFAGMVSRFALDTTSLHLASADASFRRYFRVLGTDGDSYIIMDAPPEKENSEPFVRIAQLLSEAQLPAPTVLD